MSECSKGLGFLFGVFLIIFTFVEWSPAKWITFAIGIALVLNIGSGDKNCCKPKMPEKIKSEKPKTK